MTEVAALQRGEEASAGVTLPARLRRLLPGRRNRADDKTGGRKRGPFWKRVRPATLVVLALLVGASMVRAVDPEWVEVLRVKTFDLYQVLSPRPATNQPVAIVDLDEKSLSEIGQWPWPRTVVADLIAKLGEAGAAVVGFDILFSEYDRMSPGQVADALRGLDPAVRETLQALPRNETVMAEAMRRMRTVVGQVGLFTPLPPGREPPAGKTSVKGQIGGDPRPFLLHYRSLLGNVPEIAAAAAGHGFFSVGNEIDGVVRRVPLVAVIGGKEIRPALTIEMLRAGFGGRNVFTKRNEAGMVSVILQTPRGGFEIPTDAHGRLWVHFAEPAKLSGTGEPSRLYVSASDVLTGRVGKERLQGRLVLVGTSAAGLQDIRSTPIAGRLPGVEVHANILETILSAQQSYTAAVQKAIQARAPEVTPQQAAASVKFADFFLRYPNYMNVVELTLMLVAGLAMIVLIPRVGPLWTLGGLTAAGGGLLALTWYLYTERLILVDVTYSGAVTVAAYAILTFANYTREAAEKRQVRGAFSQYLSPALVEQLAENPDRLQLGGETKEMTFLFCDVRGFTSISEQYKSDPQGLTILINRLLTPLTDTILARRGTIDKYMGDCIMAFWNAPLDVPDQEAQACDSALQMYRDLEVLNREREQEAREAGIEFKPLNIGIGINTGECVVGNMGSRQRFDYSVLGDAVNLASRLEGQSKNYGVGVVLGPETAAKARDRFAVIELDQIAVKGKKEAVNIFTLLGDEAMRQSPDFQRLAQANDAMLRAYRGQDWDTAETLARDCSGIPGAPLGLYELYLERIAIYRADPPGADWDGVFVATSK